MADNGLPVVIMGRGAWQELALDPADVESFIVKFGSELSLLTWALIISSVFVLFGLCLSFFLLFDHLSGYNKPQVRTLKPEIMKHTVHVKLDHVMSYTLA